MCIPQIPWLNGRDQVERFIVHRVQIPEDWEMKFSIEDISVRTRKFSKVFGSLNH